LSVNKRIVMACWLLGAALVATDNSLCLFRENFSV
jgi:hypothetical protein